LVQNYSPNPEPAACEPLYSEAGAFQFFTLREKPGALETVTLVGNLCTAADVVAEDLELPRLEIGDAVGITNAGAYGRVLSPDQFASVADLHEVLL
jgi:diaminopimelate decarboxylase